MLRLFLPILLLTMPDLTAAQTVVAKTTIRSQAIIQEEDLTLLSETLPGTFSRFSQITGLEARTTLYEGRPIRTSDVGPPTIIERNQIVALVFLGSGLSIRATARALGRAGVGDNIRVINTASKKIVNGIVTPNGDVMVGSANPRREN